MSPEDGGVAAGLLLAAGMFLGLFLVGLQADPTPTKKSPKKKRRLTTTEEAEEEEEEEKEEEGAFEGDEWHKGH
jgi:hypothetical protein